MTTALSSLRVTADMDVSGYTAAMAAKVAADQAGTASATALGVALAQTDAAAQTAVPGVASLSRQFINGYGSAAQFEAAVRRVGNAMDQGLNATLAGTLLDNIYQKYGLLADAAVLASQGFVSLVPVIDNLNGHYLTQIEILNRVTQAQTEAATAAAYQASINERLGVVTNPTSGAAQASADAMMAQFGGLQGIAQAQAQQIADGFSTDLDQRLIAGIPKSARDSATVFQEQFKQLDQIAQLQAQQTGQYFSQDLDASLIAGVAKSAKDSASVFQQQFAQLGLIAQQQAEQAGANFQNSLNESFGIGVAPKSASQSASVFTEIDQQAKSLDNLKQQYDPLYAAQVKFAEAQTQIDDLLAKGVINEQQYAAANNATQQTLNRTVQSLNSAGQGGNLLESAFRNLSFQLVAMSAGLGPIGIFLAGLGPEGIGAAIGIGLAYKAIEFLVAGADDLAQRAVGLETFSVATGLTTDQIQGLGQAGAQFDVTVDSLTRYMQIFTAALGQAQQGTGTLFTSLLKINPQLALQVSGVKNAQQGWDLLSQAYKSATDAGNTTAASAISRSMFGRNGAHMGPLLGFSASSGGIQSISDAAQGAGGTLDKELIEPLQQLNAQLEITKTKATVTFESMFAEQTLSAELEFYQGLEKISALLADLQQNGSGAAEAVKDIGVGLLSAIPGVGPLLSLVAANTVGQQKRAAPAAPDDQGALGVSAEGLAGLGGGEASLTATSAALYGVFQKTISVLGAAATPAQHLELELLALKKAADEGTSSNSQYTLSAAEVARAQGILVEAFNVTKLQANISAMGALATPTQQYTLAVAQLKLQLDESKISQGAFNVGILAAQQQLQTSTEAIKEAYGIATPSDVATAQLTKFNTQMGAIGATAPQVAQGFGAVQKSIQNTSDAMKVLGSSTPNFTQLILDLQNANKTKDELLTSSGNALLQAAPAFVQALQQGQTIAQAIATSLTGAANSIANAFATAGAKQIAGSLLGGGSSSSGSGGISGAIGGALSGALGLGSLASGLATGGVSMAIGAGISMITGSITKSQQAQQAFQQAQATWAGMASQVASFTQQMDSGGNGSLTSALSQAQSQAQSFADAAHAAGEGADEINAALATFATREVGDFIATFDTMIDSLNSGLGFNSPAVTAAQNVAQIATQLEGFIQDTETVASTIGGAATAVQAAQSASQSYALTLLDTPPALDTIETQFATIQGTAAQLGSVLQDLGMSADDAAAAIKSGVNEAIANLQVSFTQTLQQQINTAQGNDWINQLQALIQSSNQNLSDANLLGVDPSIVADAFQAQAQQIVDSAGLTGTAFQQLITLFPQLTGVVTQSTTAVAQQIAYYQQLQTTITSYLNGLNVSSQSPLSPSDQLASAQQTYQQQLALAQGGNQDALNNITNTASSYLNTAQSYYASSGPYAGIYNQIQQDLQNLVPTAEANDPLTKIANNTATTNGILTVLQSLNQSTTDSSTTIAQAIQSLGSLSADVANGQSTQFFGPMTGYLSQIAVNTATAGSAAAPPKTNWLERAFGLQSGGVVPIVGRYAPGGIVGNGVFNADSVRAHFAGGGDIMLAGGEFVTKATSVNSGTLAALSHINKTGRAPSNDNGVGFAAVGSMISQAIVAGSMAQIGVMQDQISGLREDVRALNTTFKSMKRPERPGTKKAA